MGNINSTKQTIENTQFPAELKTRLISVLPLLDSATLNRLEGEVAVWDSFLIAGKITAMWERFGKILNGMKQHDASAKDDFFQLLRQTEYELNDEHKIYVLNLVVDVRRLAERNAVVFSKDEMEDIIAYETSLFRVLPQSEIGFLIIHYLSQTLSRINLLKELQIAIVDQEWRGLSVL